MNPTKSKRDKHKRSLKLTLDFDELEDSDKRRHEKSHRGSVKKRGQKSSIDAHLKKGLITILYSGIAEVLFEGRRIICRIKKNLIEGDSRSLSVGDHVGFTLCLSTGEGKIQKQYPRINSLKRVRSHKSRDQYMAANIDYLMVMMATRDPAYSLGLLDRFLIIGHRQSLQVALIINKIDLLGDNLGEMAIFDYYKRELGIPLFFTSTESSKGIDEIKEFIKENLCVLLGHSGVGKSSLFNSIFSRKIVKTRNIREKDGKGQHTTTSSLLFPLCNGGLIDTPGIRMLSPGYIEDRDLKRYYPDFIQLSVDCQMVDCCHRDEPGCRVREEVENGHIPEHRYRNYLKLHAELGKENADWWEIDSKEG